MTDDAKPLPTESMFSKQGIITVMIDGQVVNNSPPVLVRIVDPMTVYPNWDIEGRLSVRVVQQP